MFGKNSGSLFLSVWNVLRLYTPSTKTTGIVVKKLGRTCEVDRKTRLNLVRLLPVTDGDDPAESCVAAE
jgi:hypothetical protein